MIASEIKPRRLELNLFQKDLAKAAGCSRKTIVELETGKSQGSDLVLHRIDKALTKLESDHESK